MVKKLKLLTFAAILAIGPVGCGKSTDDVPKTVGEPNPNLKLKVRSGFKTDGAAPVAVDGENK